MDFNNFGKALERLGEAFSEAGHGNERGERSAAVNSLIQAVKTAQVYNPWFIPEFISFSCRAWAEALRKAKIERWLGEYSGMSGNFSNPKKVGVVMAGNLPMVGLHDLLCVLAAGHVALVKLSSQDDRLIPALAEVLFEADPALRERIIFMPERLKGFDAMIATGSNNSFRYFEYYFRNVPSLIRRNRNGVALISGSEPDDFYRSLADDIFLYFGLGCRSVSKLFVPRAFDLGPVMKHFDRYAYLIHHNKYCNNYDYQKSLLMINRDMFHDNGYVLVKPSASLASPVAVVHYEYFEDYTLIPGIIKSQAEDIQCVVAQEGWVSGSVCAGESQKPELWDYADGVDTMQFLLGL